MKDSQTIQPLFGAIMLSIATIVNAFMAGFMAWGRVEPVAVGIVTAGAFVVAGATVMQWFKYLINKKQPPDSC